MKIKQLTSYPIPNEIGLGNTNESYIRIENSIDVSDMFPPNIEVEVVDCNSNRSYKLKSKDGIEFRINQLGQLYRDYNFCPGDEIKFTQIDVENKKTIFFTVSNYNRAYLNVSQKGTEIVNIERLIGFFNKGLQEYSILVDEGTLKLSFDKSEKKRSDSPSPTDFYRATVNDVDLRKGTYYITIKGPNVTIEKVEKNKVEEFFIPDNNVKDIDIFSKHPLQQIFYGAPGTGKSHKVKEVTETLPKSDVFRTTFHPDSDYSTFVGCYKPKMVKAPIRDSSGHEITSACEDEKKRIAYEYEPQAFLKAYVRAYETNDPVFLVIEEINRGNCAQIFGDMFQLLDRNENGESDYAIKPETAIQEFLNEKLKDCDIEDEAIKSGEEMRLPANLHIWATMNTSDQSLFPIDSAFKRRWDWKYVPIDTRKESWGIKVNGTEYSWSSFLEKINEEIGDVTSSEDKKLGFYFCKAENGIISAEKFVSKVLFYIYNDVFKDYGFESSKNKNLFKDGDNKLAFGTFYSDNGNIREEKVDLFLKNLGVEDAKRNNMISNDEEDEDGNSSTTESSSRNYDKFSINGSGRYAKNNLAAECVKKYIELNSDITVEEVLHNWSDFKNLVPHFMESKDKFDARTDNSKRSHEIPCNGSVLYVAHNGYGSNGKAQILMDSVNQKGWGLTIERHNA